MSEIPGGNRERLRAWLLRSTTAALCLIGGLALLGLPLETTEPDLDPSWVEAYVHFTKTRAQAGVDYWFTYGPLAHFIAPAYDPDLYTLDLVVVALLAMLLLLPYVWAAVRRKNLITTLFLIWIVGVLVPRSMGNEVGSCIAVITVTILLLEVPGKSAYVCAVTGVVFAFLSLTKFTSLVMCAASTGVLCLQWWFTRGKAPDGSRWIAALVASYGLTFVAFWLLAGQRIEHLWAYMMSSIEVSRAYAMGMQTPLDPFLFYIGIAILLLVAGQWIAVLAGGKDGPAYSRAALLFACFALVLAWKMGVARSQPPKFYVPAAAVAVLLGAPRNGSVLRQGLRQCVPLLVLILATAGILHVYGRSLHEHLAQSLSGLAVQSLDLVSPLQRRKHLDTIHAAYRTAFAYPEIRRIVGQDTVDMFNPNQSVILFNQMNYHPRPVFQGYVACSPQLARLNGAFYDSPDAPKYVMYLGKLIPIDGRYPPTEDPETLKAIFRNYRPVHWERQFVLLKKIEQSQGSGAEPDHRHDIRQGAARLNEWIPLDDPGDDWQLLALHLKPSLAWRLRAIVFQPPMPLLEVRHTDGSVETSRINIGSIETGFIINPVFEHVDSVADWPGASTTRRVEALRVLVADGRDGLLEPEFSYEITTVPPLSRAANQAARMPVDSAREHSPGR